MKLTRSRRGKRPHVGRSLAALLLVVAACTPATTSTTPTTSTTVPPTSTTILPTTTDPAATTIPLPAIPQADLVFAPPTAGPSGNPSAPLPQGAEAVTVISITDGDTLDITTADGTSDTIRLIGVNSPETGECFSDEAALVLNILTPEENHVGLTTDVSDRDQYDRLLRYVWVGGLSVNEELVRRGAAISRQYPPDTAMATRFEQAQLEAKNQELGLWEPDACGPDAGTQIAVVEVEADAPSDDNQDLNSETVHLRNNGHIGVDLTDWVLKDESASHRYTFPLGFVLAAGAQVAVHTGCGIDTIDTLYWCNNGAVWNNDGDTAFITDHNGNIVDSLPYVPPSTTTTTTAPVATTKPAQDQCHPSYTGECVPFASDVDCRGGSGNGPYYVGRVTVIGPDVYDLDRDGDGIGCE